MSSLSIIRSLLLIIALTSISCSGLQLGDPAYTPTIVNGCGVPISFVATFADGKSSPGTLPPGASAVQGISGRHLSSISITRQGASPTLYSAAALNRLRRDPTVDGEIWVVSEQGITLGDRQSVEAALKQLSNPRK